MDEAYVVPRRAAPDATGREPHALRRQPFDGRAQVIDPQADVVEPRLVDFWSARRIDRLHQIDLDAGEREDVLVDVLLVTAKCARRREAEQVDPEVAKRGLARPADRDLLETEDAAGLQF